MATNPSAAPSAERSGTGSDVSRSSRPSAESALVQYRLPILSGLLIGTSYIPFPPWALFFCLVPLFVFWYRAPSKKQAFIGGWITQFILNLIGFHWIAHTAVEFGHFPWWGGILTLLGFAAIAHLYYPVAGWLAFVLIKRLKISKSASLATFALAFALCDRLFPMIFPWHLGYPWLWANLPGSQLSDVIGFEGLNVLTIVANALVAWSVVEGLLNFKERKTKPRWIVGGALVLVLLVNLAGLGRATPWKTTDAQLDVLAVQGNIGNFEKFMVEDHADFRAPIVQKFLTLTRKGAEENPDAQIAIWPETAFPAFLDREWLREPLQAGVRDFLREIKMPLLAGAYSRQWPSKQTYNGFFYLDASGGAPLPPYRKTILLVFGETFPFSEYIPYMDKFFPDQGGFDRGRGPTVMNLKIDGRRPTEVAIGPQICYEGLYPWFTAELARQGAQVIANVTNDSWFGQPFEPNQHLYMTLARAIEFRRPLFRSTNTGITTAVLASGEILQKSPIGEEWTGVFKIPYLKNPPHTTYEKFGSIWPWLLAGALALVPIVDRLILSRIGLLSGRGRAKSP